MWLIAGIILLGSIAVFVAIRPKRRHDGAWLVREIHGKGQHRSPVFTVKDDWRWEFECRGEGPMFFDICYPDGRRAPGSVSPMTGRAYSEMGQYVAAGGSYYFDPTWFDGDLRSKDIGPWKLSIFQYDGRID